MQFSIRISNSVCKCILDCMWAIGCIAFSRCIGEHASVKADDRCVALTWAACESLTMSICSLLMSACGVAKHNASALNLGTVAHTEPLSRTKAHNHIQHPNHAKLHMQVCSVTGCLMKV